MLRLLKVTLAVGILLGSYTMTFGVPSPVVSLLPGANAAQNSQSEKKPPSGRGGRTSTVVLAPLELTPYTATIQSIGTGKSLHSVEVVSEVTGQVTEVFIEANASVEAGDPLIQLDNRTQILNVQMAEAQWNQAGTLVNRYKKIRESGAASISDAELDEAILEVTQARIAINLAKEALNERTIRAPISGRLGLTDISIGDSIDESDVLVSIDDSTNIIIEFEVPERAISLLSVGRKVLASTPSYAGRVFEAELTAFDSRLNNQTRSVSVQAQVDNVDSLLWSGMTFAVRLLNDSEPMATIPSTALSWARHGAGIWTVENGIASRQPVTVRFRQGGTVWVDTDVTVGTTIVTEGAVKLREGSTVESIPSVLSSDTPIRGTAASITTGLNDADDNAASEGAS